ncbi:MAG: ribonuclease R [Gammaproteobacteria bacterium]|nr:ribonuclease R [Gammaproteobacteria bacterium]MCP5201207.1 ribonuclease R [Gammaproteobacteria bacterium]
MRRKPSRASRAEPAEFEHVADLPSRDDIGRALAELGAPSDFDAVARALGVTHKAARHALERRMAAMTRDGQLVRTRGERYGLADRMELIPGRVLAHRDGYAFVRPETGEDDIYLAPREACRALHGDKVLVRVAGFDRRDRPYGHLVEILERAHERIVGRYFRDRGFGRLVPDNHRLNQDLIIPAGAEGGAHDGQIVVATIEQQPERHQQPVGRVVEILGEHMAPGMEIEIALRSHHLPCEWPADAAREAARVPQRVPPAELARRRDLRGLALVTIDGADARDFDDAVHARRTGKGFALTVAIADVAHYVRPGSALDEEARRRGTSVYFPDRVIPMLPEALSNGLCSLVPDEDRLAMVCELTITADGEVRRARFYEAVIRSHARLIYTDVQRWQDGAADALPGLDADVAANLAALYDLYASLRQAREARGALDIDTVEPRFHYDEQGKIARIEGTVRVDAHRLIEECMIAANVAAARRLERSRQAALYRVHDVPAEDKVEELGRFLGELGLGGHLGQVATPESYAAVLAAATGRADRRLVETVVLRSLKLAVYSAENSGHFGLALDAYTHFTSPIRRYPDLIVHRALKAVLGSGEGPEQAHMVELAEHCSMCERRADDATRDVIGWLKCEFMQERIGEVFPAIISGVAEFGVFVELDDIFVEGLVHVTELPGDYYLYDAARHVLRGRASHREFHLGQAVEVRLARVDLDERKIDFTLADAGEGRSRRGRRRR